MVKRNVENKLFVSDIVARCYLGHMVNAPVKSIVMPEEVTGFERLMRLFENRKDCTPP
jgi:hypothetical protein